MSAFRIKNASAPQGSSSSRSSSSSSSSCKVQVEYVDFEDGHRPGNTSEKTRLARNLHKQSTAFLSVFDDLLDPLWCERAYTYALSRQGKPFGVYIQTADALDTTLDAEALWTNQEYQRALALVATRALGACLRLCIAVSARL